MLDWVAVPTVGNPLPGVERTTMNYFACMGGGLDEPATANRRLTAVAATRRRTAPAARWGSLSQRPVPDPLDERLHARQSPRDARRAKVRGRTFATPDGTSNSILVGETIYQNMQINRGWGSSHRTKHASNNGPGNITGTYRAINSGKALYDAFSDRTTDQNIHNHLMNTCFGSLHPGGASSAWATAPFAS